MSPERGERPLLLAYRALGLGDLLTAVPALRALARAHPDHRRVLCAPVGLAPLVALADPLAEVSDTAPLAPVAAELRGASVAVNLHGRGPQSHRALRATHPGRLIAFGCPQAEHAGPPWWPDEHEVQRWCRLLAESGIPADPRDLRLRLPPWPAPPGTAGATVIHPGAASPARRWPAARFAAVARAAREAGALVVITGSRDERQLADRVATLAGLPAANVWAGRTDLAALVALVAAAERVICGDTGMAHLATATGTPSVVLFGPTPPALWGPPVGASEHIALWAGRRGDPHGAEPDAGLVEITAEAVLAALERLPTERAGGGRRTTGFHSDIGTPTRRAGG